AVAIRRVGIHSSLQRRSKLYSALPSSRNDAELTVQHRSALERRLSQESIMEARAVSTPDPEPFRLALRVRHPSMDPSELSRVFGIEPEHSLRAGDSWGSRKAEALDARVHPESYWLGDLNPTGRRPPLGLAILGDPQNVQRQVAAFRKSLSWALSL